MDATVYYGQTDFRFENSTDYPIKIVTSSYDQGGKRKLNVKIYGTNVDGIRAEPKSTVYETVSPTTQYKADESITQGTTKVDSKQNPYTGKSAQTYRYIYDRDGNLLEKQDMGKSVYKMRPKTILYNPADGDPATWPNGVPRFRRPHRRRPYRRRPRKNTGAETPLEDPGTEAPAESGGGQETPPQRNSVPGSGGGPVHPRMLEAQRRRQGMFQGFSRRRWTFCGASASTMSAAGSRPTRRST